jgi:hypothetical protein
MVAMIRCRLHGHSLGMVLDPGRHAALIIAQRGTPTPFRFGVRPVFVIVAQCSEIFFFVCFAGNRIFFVLRDWS